MTCNADGERRPRDHRQRRRDRLDSEFKQQPFGTLTSARSVIARSGFADVRIGTGSGGRVAVASSELPVRRTTLREFLSRPDV